MGAPPSPRLRGGQFIAATRASGRCSTRSSAIKPGLPKRYAHSPWIQAAAAPAASGDSPWAIRPAGDAGQHVARSGRRQRRRRMDIDDRPAIRRRDHRVGPLEQDGRPAPPCRRADALDLAGTRRQLGEKAAELAFMRREQNRAWRSPRTDAAGSSAKTVIGVGVEHDAPGRAASAASTASRVRSFTPEPGPIRKALRRLSSSSRERRPSSAVVDQVAGLGHRGR